MSPEHRTFEELERLRQSVAMITPGQLALGREDALDLLEEMQQIRRTLEEVEGGLRQVLGRLDDQ